VGLSSAICETELVLHVDYREVPIFNKYRENYLKRIYRTNPETNAFIIDISLNDYEELFNGWDPSPLTTRDLDPELLRFIDQCGSDIPMEFRLEIDLHLPREKFDKERESLCRTGIKNNFDFTSHFIAKNLSRLRQEAMIYVSIGFAFLAVGHMSKSVETFGIVPTVLMEGLSIGGWVFLWEAFTRVFFTGQEVRNGLGRYKRLQGTEIVFVYA